jgi:hypothetical protein
MKFTVIDYLQRSEIYLLDDFFPADLAKEILTVFDNFNEVDWPDTPEFSHKLGRRLYQGPADIGNKIMQFASSKETLPTIEGMLKTTVSFAGSSLWADFEGYIITPHVDPTFFDFAVQIYMTHEPTQWNGSMIGTTIYLSPDKILCQLPYRHNSGYCFQKPSQVLHGLGMTVPAGMQRNSVYLRYNKK